MSTRPRSGSRTAVPLALAAALLALAACGEDGPDAYGNFEATEVVISAETGGRLLRFDADEGDHIEAGATVARIDTTDLALQRRELVTQRSAARSRTAEAEAQIGVLRAQLETARDEYERTLRLFRAEAATAQQLDRAEGEVRVIEQRIQAARVQTGVAREEADVVAARLAQVEEQISDSRVVNPVAGTVLTTYAEVGEFVQPGQPLYEIANLDTLTLRAYVGGAQLPALRLGERVRVQVDDSDGGLRALDGRVSWIASEAQFTPTPIQTREERTEQVYAVEVRVANPDGTLKIGMPGELVFTADAEPRPPERAGS